MNNSNSGGISGRRVLFEDENKRSSIRVKPEIAGGSYTHGDLLNTLLLLLYS